MNPIHTAFLLAAATLTVSAQEPAPQKLKPVVIKGSAIGGEITAVTPSLDLAGPDWRRFRYPLSATCSLTSPAWLRATSVLIQAAQ